MTSIKYFKYSLVTYFKIFCLILLNTFFLC